MSTCEDCAFFRTTPETKPLGECSRFPPAKPGNFPDEPWRLPVVPASASCGEHKTTIDR
jgi:hypothetical protein